MIKVSDYIAKYLADYGVRHVFMLTGGGAMHLNDSFGKEKRIQYICNHHEQACAIAAEGYARVKGHVGVACVTTGPGGTNTITGVLGQWLDSIPALYISGQVRYETTAASTGLPLRQLGDQEADIVSIIKPITKYTVLITDPKSIRYHLEKALHLATSGRPGPVWLDVPLNIQASMVEESTLIPYDNTENNEEIDAEKIHALVDEAIRRLRGSERPVILAGAGIRLAGAYQEFHTIIEKLRIPVLAAWNAIDLISSDHPLFFGRPSTLGQRGANFIFQNSDLLLSIGCRLNVRQIGYSFSSVARCAFKISVDIDPFELQKPTIPIDLPVHCDAKTFLEVMNHRVEEVLPEKTDWLSWCRERVHRYPTVLSEYSNSQDGVHPYMFCEILSKHLEENDVIVSANGSACVIPIQAFIIKNNQRHLVNSGCAAMGYGLPAAIGACFANRKKRVICLEGDGSIQLNIQELQTVVHHQLPLKIFIFNNGGYLSIRTTQMGFFDGHFVGESPRSGVSFPDMVKIASAYGIKALRIHRHAEMQDVIDAVLQDSGPVLCDVCITPEQLFTPRTASQRLPDGRMVSKPLEDLYPFLNRQELEENMIIPIWDS